MKLNELYSRPIKDVIADMDISEFKVHSNPQTNEVMCIEMKYMPKDTEVSDKKNKRLSVM